jgi:hypothetical protein
VLVFTVLEIEAISSGIGDGNLARIAVNTVVEKDTP